MKTIKKILLGIVIAFLAGIVLLFGIDLFIKFKTANKIVEVNDISGEADAIIVLGAGIRNGSPSPMLQERLDKGIELYKDGVAPKIVMSGDHGSEDHDEVNVMKDYAVLNGVLSEDIFMDHAGFSTYDTMYRAKEIFGIEKAVVVTQKYHLYRSIYVAESLGIDVVGVDAEVVRYSGQILRDFREILARDKDFLKCILKPKSTYLGETIPIEGNGNMTNDKKYLTINKADDNEEYLYISSQVKINEIQKIIDEGQFVETDCSKKQEYMLVFSTGETYGLEAYEEIVHVINGDNELILNREDSNIILDLLNI